jgi:hypothetical protein
MLKKHCLTSPIFANHPYLGRMERGIITGSGFLVLVTISSVIQDYIGFENFLQVPDNVIKEISPETGIITLVGGFFIMRTYKTLATCLLSS